MASESKDCDTMHIDDNMQCVVVTVEGMHPQTVDVKKQDGVWVSAGAGCCAPVMSQTNYGVYYSAEWSQWRPKLWELFETDDEARNMCRTLNMLFRSCEAPFAKTWVTPSSPVGADPVYTLGGTSVGGVLGPEDAPVSNLVTDAEAAAARLRDSLFPKRNPNNV